MPRGHFINPKLDGGDQAGNRFYTSPHRYGGSAAVQEMEGLGGHVCFGQSHTVTRRGPQQDSLCVSKAGRFQLTQVISSPARESSPWAHSTQTQCMEDGLFRVTGMGKALGQGRERSPFSFPLLLALRRHIWSHAAL